MTINSAIRTAGPFLGNDITTVYPFGFKVFTRADVLVVRTNPSTGISYSENLDSDYTVTLNADQNANPGGIVTMAAPIGYAYTLTLTSQLAYLQPLDLTNQGGFYPRVISDAFDRVVIFIQQLASIANRSLRFPLADTGVNTELPLSASRANNLLGFDANGNPVAVAPAAQSATALQGQLSAGTGAELVGSGNRTVADALKERRSIMEWATDAGLKAAISSGAYNATTRAAMLAAVNSAWTSALSTPHDLHFPAGRYELGDYSFPWRQSGAVAALLDCKNVTIYGAGAATVFATTSAGGADVFQLNGVKNLHLRKLRITAALTATAGAGSNAISVTGGYDNITIEDVIAENCQAIDKADHIDGGKGLSIQCDAATLEVGTLRASMIVRKCSQGFGFEAGLSNFLSKKVAVDVDLIAEDCYVAVAIGGAAAAGAIPVGTHMGINVRGQAINCQKDVMLARAHGVQVDMQVITTKTDAARRLDPRGVAWYAADQVVEALLCTYAKNSQVRVTGSKGTCGYKARIGGASAGASGLNGATEHCDIFLDIGGTASVAGSEVVAVDSGGNILSNSRLSLTNTTSTTPDAAFYPLANNNVIVIGPATRLIGTTLAGHTGFAPTAGGTFELAAIDAFGGVPGLQGKGSSSAAALVVGLFDQAGNMGLGIKNPGRPCLLPAAMPVCADNATAVAGGFVAGDVYRTAAGVLMVVY